METLFKLTKIKQDLENCFKDGNMDCDGAYCAKCWKDIVREAIKDLDSILLPVSEKQIEENWISVEERLPNLKPYYDTHAMRTMRPATYECIVTDGDNSWADNYSLDDGFHKSVTHWMPLPQPPKK